MFKKCKNSIQLAVMLSVFVLLVSALPANADGPCHYCLGGHGWEKTGNFLCGAAGFCEPDRCTPCTFKLEYGTCVPGGTGSCYTNTWGYTTKIVEYYHDEPSALVLAACWVAYQACKLIDPEDDNWQAFCLASYCICTGGECVETDVHYSNWDGGCT